MSQFKNEVISNDSNRKFYLYLAILPSAVAVLLIFFIIIFFQFLPPRMPLFYSLPWGDLQLANRQQFFMLPTAIIIVNIINLFIIWHLHSSQRFFKNIL